MSGMTAASIGSRPCLRLIHCSQVPRLFVEADDILGRPSHVGFDKADARIQLARMPFDLGDDTARFRPASGLIDEVRVEAAHTRSADARPERVSKWPILLQDAVGGETDRILDALGFEKLIDVRIGEVHQRGK